MFRPLPFLLLAIAVLAAGVARAEEAEAVRTIERLGGRFKAEKLGGVKVEHAQCELSECSVSSESLAALAEIKGLTRLRLSRVKVDDWAWLNALQLEELHLHHCNSGDDGFNQACRLVNLRVLGTCDTGLTDQGLKSIAILTQLEKLEMTGEAVTDAAFQDIRKLSRLNSLRLNFTKVTIAGACTLKDLKSLLELEILGCKAAPLELTGMKSLESLEVLWLGGPQMTDERILELKECSRLKTLWLINSAVTDEGMVRLRVQIPGLSVLK